MSLTKREREDFNEELQTLLELYNHLPKDTYNKDTDYFIYSLMILLSRVIDHI